MPRVGIFGWGVVAPRSPNIDRFAENLGSTESWLETFNGYGPDNFLVGLPEFRFADYREWIASRFPPARFHQLEEKMDLPVQFAIGAFIQALGQNPGLEGELRSLGTAAHVYMGTGIGCIDTISRNTRALDRAQRRWDRFWAERNPAFLDHLEGPAEAGAEGLPPDPATVADPEDRYEAEAVWWHHWAASSPRLHDYLRELAAIEGLNVQGDIEKSKVSVMKEKQRRLKALHERWNEPTPPWGSVSANVVWNIWNTPAAQISMMGHITGLAFAPVAACSTFGVCLKLGMDAIRRGEAKAVVVGATDPPPLALTVGAFYAARVISADAAVSKPLTGLRGTHVAGGSVLWILGDLDYMREKGFKALGMEPVAVGVTARTCRPHHHPLGPRADGGDRERLRGGGGEVCGRRHLGPPRHRHPRRLPRGRDPARGGSRLGAGDRAQGDLRPRHVGRRRLGADRAVPGLRAGEALHPTPSARRSSTARSRASTTSTCSTSRAPPSPEWRGSCRWGSAGSMPA